MMRVVIIPCLCLISLVFGQDYALPHLPLNFLLRNGLYRVSKSRIVGGYPVDKGEVPWQVSLRRKGFFGDSHFCGGTILNDDTILTAAHCTDGQTPSKITVMAGEHLLTSTEGDEQVAGVESIIQHPCYNSFTFTNDISILKLNISLNFGVFVQPVTLPDSMSDIDAGIMATVSGWGSTSSGGPLSNVLQAVEVPIVTDDQCRQIYGANDIADSMICAGDIDNGGVDTCQGDSGGPLFLGSTIIGIASWGHGCASPGYPSVYTQVSYFIGFINSNS
ncbi:trypsin-1-like isoform X1 [Artemia franciscana]|uniref:trypsin-1-like isoform X1 n=1 Tax=Artemia franciscana TaxID=6661 RepID=UPI0032D9DFF3